MRWNFRKFELGTKRIVKRFAFLPTCLSDSDTVVWFEFYHVEQEYNRYIYGFIPYAWIDRRRYLD